MSILIISWIGMWEKVKSSQQVKSSPGQSPARPGLPAVSYGNFSSWSTGDTRRVNLVTNPVIIHERGKDREVFTTSGTYPWLFVTQIFHSGQPSHDGDRKKTVKITISVKVSWFINRSSGPRPVKLCSH